MLRTFLSTITLSLLAATPAIALPRLTELNSSCRLVAQSILPLRYNRPISITETGLDGNPNTVDTAVIATSSDLSYITVSGSYQYTPDTWDDGQTEQSEIHRQIDNDLNQCTVKLDPDNVLSPRVFTIGNQRYAVGTQLDRQSDEYTMYRTLVIMEVDL